MWGIACRKRRLPQVVIGHRLKGVAQGEQRRFAERRAAELHGQGQAGRAEAARHRERGYARRREYGCEAWNRPDGARISQTVDRRRRSRGGRAEHGIDTLRKELTEAVAPGLDPAQGLGVLGAS